MPWLPVPDDWYDAAEEQAELREYLMSELALTIGQCEMQIYALCVMARTEDRRGVRRGRTVQLRQEMIDLYEEVARSGRRKLSSMIAITHRA